MWVRTAGPDDLAAIRSLLDDSWHDTYDALYGPEKVAEIVDDWFSPARLKDRLTLPQSEFLVSDTGEMLVGVAFARASDKNVHLDQLYVRPGYQGQRIGLGLLVEMENSFPGCETMTLEVDSRNAGAIRFYDSYGFERDSETENCGQSDSGIPAIIMKKQIIYTHDHDGGDDLLFQ